MDYLQSSQSKITQDLENVLKPWLEQLNQIDAAVKDATGLLTDLGKRLNEVREEVETIRSETCSKFEVCGLSAVKDFFGKGTTIPNSIKPLTDTNSGCRDRARRRASQGRR